jgi:4-amino-4-deoxy-L-arabinose transferase-like glycosyltransferase
MFTVKAVKKEYLMVGALVLGALLLRLLFLQTAQVLFPDGVHYSWLGRALVSGDLRQGLSIYWPPFYPLLIGIAWRLLGDLELAGRMVSVIAGSFVVIPTYLLAWHFYGNRVAIISGVLVTFYPRLLFYSTRSLTEAVYSLILMTLIWLLWKGVKEGSIRRLIGVGLLLGVAYLTKPEGIFYLILVLVCLFGLRNSSGAFDLRQRAAAAIVIVVAVGAVSFPYLAYLRHVTGFWTISQKTHLAFAYTSPTYRSRYALVNDDGTWMDNLDPSGKVRVNKDSPFRRAADNLPVVIGSAMRSAYNFYFGSLPYLLPPFLIGLVVLGLFHSSWDAQRWEQELYIALFLGATIAGYSLAIFSSRLMVPFLPLFLIWAGRGIQVLGDWGLKSLPQVGVARWAALRQPAVASGVVLAVVFVSLLPEITLAWRKGKWREPVEHKMAGRWIKSNDADRPFIMAVNPWAAFYAEGRHVYIPKADYGAVVVYARRKQVKYLIVSNRYIEKLNKDLRFLLENDAAPKDFIPVYRIDENPQFRLIVYRLRKERDEFIQ